MRALARSTEHRLILGCVFSASWSYQSFINGNGAIDGAVV